MFSVVNKIEPTGSEIKRSPTSRMLPGMNAEIWLDKPTGTEGQILEDESMSYKFYLCHDPIPDGRIHAVNVYKHVVQYIGQDPACLVPQSVVAVGQRLGTVPFYKPAKQ